MFFYRQNRCSTKLENVRNWREIGVDNERGSAMPEREDKWNRANFIFSPILVLKHIACVTTMNLHNVSVYRLIPSGELSGWMDY